MRTFHLVRLNARGFCGGLVGHEGVSECAKYFSRHYILEDVEVNNIRLRRMKFVREQLFLAAAAQNTSGVGCRLGRLAPFGNSGRIRAEAIENQRQSRLLSGAWDCQSNAVGH